MSAVAELYDRTSHLLYIFDGNIPPAQRTDSGKNKYTRGPQERNK